MFADRTNRFVDVSARFCFAPSRELGLNDHERLVSKSEVAQVLQMSQSWIDQQCRTTGLPFRQVGKSRRRFYLPDVFEWLEDEYGSQASRGGPMIRPRKPSAG